MGFMGKKIKKTEFGKYVAKLRVTYDQTQKEMANILSVSGAFLCKVENGRANPILEWVDILAESYSLSLEEEEELRRIILVERNKSSYIKNLTVGDQDLVFLLVEKISDMPSDKKEKIKKLISE